MTFVLVVLALILMVVEPVIGVVLLVLAGLNMYLKDRTKKRQREETVSAIRETAGSSTPARLCPFCAEEIKEAAVVCKHCGRDLPTNSE